MENEVQKKENKNREKYILPASILIAAVIIGGAFFYTTKLKTLVKQGQVSTSPGKKETAGEKETVEIDENLIIPQEGAELPVVWGDLGAKMVESGVIDSEKFEAIYSQRGGLDDEMKKILYGKGNGGIKITPQNSGFLLNVFWALGLGNKNDILEKGPMTDSQYGGAENFASTGGWSAMKGENVMDHYSRHQFIALTAEQQQLVERVSKGIYRPCCGNSTYFPDCNHGMAMLGFLELMASQGVSEEEMYKIALLVNSYWFPDTYLTIAKYLKVKGSSFENTDPKEILGPNYSSGSGYRAILQEVTPAEPSGGGGCGV